MCENPWLGTTLVKTKSGKQKSPTLQYNVLHTDFRHISAPTNLIQRAVFSQELFTKVCGAMVIKK